ncbi:UNVERIFIED_ORG: hypothetical protein M2328_004289 [Rhodococcus erythropolis]
MVGIFSGLLVLTGSASSFADVVDETPVITETQVAPPFESELPTTPGPGDVQARGFAKQQCGGSVRICQTTNFNSFNPFATDIQGMYASLNGGINRVGHFQFWGPRGFVVDGPNKTYGVGETYSWNGYAGGNSGDVWCARFWEGSNGNWWDVTGPICVTG